jgi:hypothetical protein
MHDSDELSIGESSIGVGLQNRGEQSHNYGGDQSHAMSSMSSPMTGGLGGFGIGKTPSLSKHYRDIEMIIKNSLTIIIINSPFQ